MEVQFCLDPGYLTHLLGCVFGKKSQGLSEYAFKQGCYKCQIFVNELKSYLNIQYSWLYPTWNTSTWGFMWVQGVWMTFLDFRRLFWPGTASWPLHRDHFGPTEVLNIKKNYDSVLRLLPTWLIRAIYEVYINVKLNRLSGNISFLYNKG